MKPIATVDHVQTVCSDHFCNGCVRCMHPEVVEVQCCCGWSCDGDGWQQITDGSCPDCGEDLESAVDEAMALASEDEPDFDEDEEEQWVL